MLLRLQTSAKSLHFRIGNVQQIIMSVKLQPEPMFDRFRHPRHAQHRCPQEHTYCGQGEMKDILSYKAVLESTPPGISFWKSPLI